MCECGLKMVFNFDLIFLSGGEYKGTLSYKTIANIDIPTTYCVSPQLAYSNEYRVSPYLNAITMCKIGRETEMK